MNGRPLWRSQATDPLYISNAQFAKRVKNEYLTWNRPFTVFENVEFCLRLECRLLDEIGARELWKNNPDVWMTVEEGQVDFEQWCIDNGQDCTGIDMVKNIRRKKSSKKVS